MSGCGGSFWGSRLGMFVWGLLLVEMHGSGGLVVGEVRCELLVLLVAGITEIRMVTISKHMP